jgi:histidine triad (HIT) family protein
MSEDFYCDEALSGRTPVEVVLETSEVLAFPSLIDLGDTDEALLHKVLAVVRLVADQVTREHGACRVLTNLGRYQDSKHLHFHVNAGEPLLSTGAVESV